MKSFKGVIARYAATKKLGGEEISRPATEKDQLREDLNNISKRNGTIFWVILIIIILLFALSLLFIAMNQDEPDKIKLIFGITGISVMGLIYYMVKIWKEKNYIDMTLILVRTLKEETVFSILNALHQKL